MNCVILCGGKSSRMKANKALLPFGDYKLITYQYIKLSKIFKKVFISIKDFQQDSILSALQDDLSKYNLENPPIDVDSIDFIVEKSNIFAPIVGILNSFDVTNIDKLFFISCDCPLVKLKTFQILSNNSDDYDVTYAKDSTKTHPLVAVWSAKTKEKLKEAIEMNNFKIMELLEHFYTKSIYFDKLEFFNLNTKSDYKKALKLLE
nr:NTP transferase domain-containing protein [Helicobacter sp. 16-1353]